METKEQLKAKAYDIIAQREYLDRVLQDLNMKIANYKEPVEKTVEKNG